MRNLKTKSISTSCVADKNAEGASEKKSSSSISDIFSYPDVWKQAFTLGQNVRFTRTPEVEILRRRIETDPIFAKRFKALQEKQKYTGITKTTKEAMKSQLTDEINSQSIANKESLYCSTVIGKSIQQVVSTPIEKNTGKHILPVESVVQKVKPVVYLSDNAFFECAPFILEQISIGMSQKEKTVMDSTNIDVTNNEVASENFSVFDEEIIACYRVLECRLPQFCDSAVSEDSNKSSEEISNLNSTESKNIREMQVHSTHAVFESKKKVEQAQKFPVIEVSVQEESDMKGIVVNDNNVADLPVIKTKENTQKAVNTPFRSSDFVSMPSFRSVAYDTYEFPPVNLLQEPVFHDDTIISQETLERSAGLLESVLEDFGIKGEIIHVRPGPVVTMYEFEPAAGVKSSRVIGLSDDIARSMSAISARVAVIPGRNVIGIELPNAVRETVYLRELIQSRTFRDSQFKLALALGKGINGEAVIAELAKMPHLLVSGTTGSGKSVAINTMILSILYRMTPEQCRLIMVDPKMLELSIYDGIPHLLTPVVTDPKKAVTALKWAVREMEDRYRKMAKLGVRNIDGFNARVALAREKGETIMCTVQSGFDKESGEMLYHEEAMDLTQLPYIVVIVDEMADLMMVAGKEIESAIQRLAQMARAAGIHLIMATQRPSVDVITGTIKANFPTRISFQVTSKIDSRTILGEQGAETLLGQGDMLHMVGGGRIVRVHGPFVSDQEVEAVVEHLKIQGKPEYLATVTDSEDDNDGTADSDAVAEIVAAGSSNGDSEELYVQAVKLVVRDKKCSTSYIQRRLAIGYNKAASLVERMEEEGIVGAANHVGKREILLSGCNNQGDLKSV
ncbi:DNA translocase FtsK [Bartonella sp. A05]|uniref:DNA translocase FtsK n=1 Tax=Bartonella sp. A05 TaxID=2967261 RepID=UPI0022A98327|nr:DNA translocase FtsK [Bartonella sp. A05]MCZ2203308.1 FtsK/SpoIIIE domain-containing protein [Bartonella sp. A05]